MNLNDLLRGKGFDPKNVLVLRHSPLEPKLKKVLRWLAAERPDIFNAYQQTQTKQVEGEMERASHVASFIGHEPGKALFIGLYAVTSARPIGPKEYHNIPAAVELEAFGVSGPSEESLRSKILWFELEPTDFYPDWKGKLVVRWPPLDKNWHRWAYKPKNEMPVLAVLHESALDAAMPKWDDLILTWDQLRVIPTSWKLKLAEWRGVYYVYDDSDGKGYVGSAYGEANLLGRWLNYAERGHGGNRLLRQRDPKDFHFSILQLVAPTDESSAVIRLESTWKRRLHTHHPLGLNEN